MKTNNQTESFTPKNYEADTSQTADSLVGYSDYVRFIDSALSGIDESYQAYLTSRDPEGVTDQSDSVDQLDSIYLEILGLSGAFKSYTENPDHETPLRLDVNQLHQIASLSDAMSADTENVPSYLSQAMDDELGEILQLTTDANDPGDRDHLFANAYLAHRENDTPIIEEYNKNLREIQAFLPDGEKILYRPGLESYNNETVREILKKEKFGQAVMDYARHNKLIEYNQDLHIEWHRQAARAKVKK
ncbi:MAG: hypothetical protein L0H36_00545 [bacterium]|nr:hypothetical protein [bacterium]MDN5835106.1 hypothetical protein [bacterium]